MLKEALGVTSKCFLEQGRFNCFFEKIRTFITALTSEIKGKTLTHKKISSKNTK